jgi:hypothetical protein
MTCILPHESKFLYVRCLQIHAFDERTMSNTEAENSSIKTGTGNTLISQQLHSAGKTLNDKSKVRSTAHAQSYATHAMSSGMWSNTETSNIVTPYAEGLLQANWERSFVYASVQIDAETWYVRKLPVPWVPSLGRPRFCRVQILRLVNKKHLVCSCGYFDCHGLPCPHQSLILGPPCCK